MCSVDFDVRPHFFGQFNYVETYRLTLTITICPNLESMTVFAVNFDVLDNLSTRLNWYFLHSDLK